MVNGLYKAELINRHGLWQSVEEVDLATAEWVHFWTPGDSIQPAATSRWQPGSRLGTTSHPAARPA